MLKKVAACGQKVVGVTQNQWLPLKRPGIVGEEEVHDSSIVQLHVNFLLQIRAFKNLVAISSPKIECAY